MTQVSVCQSQSKLHSVHPPLSAGGRGGVEPPTYIVCIPPFLQGGGGGLTRPELLESLRGVAGKEGVTFFRAEDAIVT